MSGITFEINRDKLESTAERIFNAPRESVWRAHTDPQLIERWWGPRKYKVIVEEYEPRQGGKWRIVHEAENEKHVFFGEFREIREPELIVWTFNYEPYPNTETVETLHFEELPDGTTQLRTVSHYPSLEALDGMTQSGMEEGMKETWERLEEVVMNQK